MSIDLSKSTLYITVQNLLNKRAHKQEMYFTLYSVTEDNSKGLDKNSFGVIRVQVTPSCVGVSNEMTIHKF